ncbi:hypothetical protein [Spiroplasma endosymbiont of Stenodema calcarata]
MHLYLQADVGKAVVDILKAWGEGFEVQLLQQCLWFFWGDF